MYAYSCIILASFFDLDMNSIQIFVLADNRIRAEVQKSEILSEADPK